jgi:hypothetical protein
MVLAHECWSQLHQEKRKLFVQDLHFPSVYPNRSIKVWNLKKKSFMIEALITTSNFESSLMKYHVHFRNVFSSAPTRIRFVSSALYCRRNNKLHSKCFGCAPEHNFGFRSSHTSEQTWGEIPKKHLNFR